jgi:ribosome maturation factor RimP
MPPATTGASAAQAREHLLTLLRPLVTAAGYDLEDITVSPAGRRSLVRVTVDADGGIDLDAVAAVSRVVSDALDADPSGSRAFGGSYVLEVSSPGVDRPLTERRHWRRAAGRKVSVEVDGRTVIGRVGTVDDDGIELVVDDGPRRLAWSEIGRGRVQVEFNRPDEEE